MKKKIVNALLSAAVITTMLFSVTACGSKDDGVQDTGVNTVEPDGAQQEAADLADDLETAAESTVIDGQEAAEADTQESTADELEETREADEPGETIFADGQEIADADIDAQESAAEEPEDSKKEKEDSKKAEKGAMTLEKWIKSEECAEFSAMMNEGLDGMTISFEVHGDTLSMIFTMTEAIDVAENADEAMNEYFTSNAVIFEAIRDQLISETGNQNTVLRLIYRNADNTEIFSMDF